MQKSPLSTNPFALMMEPEAVLEALEQVQRLGRVKGRIYRPLDKSGDAEASDEPRGFERRPRSLGLHD